MSGLNEELNLGLCSNCNNYPFEYVISYTSGALYWFPPPVQKKFNLKVPLLRGVMAEGIFNYYDFSFVSCNECYTKIKGDIKIHGFNSLDHFISHIAQLMNNGSYYEWVEFTEAAIDSGIAVRESITQNGEIVEAF